MSAIIAANLERVDSLWSTARKSRAEDGRLWAAAARFWIFDFGFWIESGRSGGRA
jgi:hypothetical protein